MSMRSARRESGRRLTEAELEEVHGERGVLRVARVRGRLRRAGVRRRRRRVRGIIMVVVDGEGERVVPAGLGAPCGGRAEEVVDRVRASAGVGGACAGPRRDGKSGELRFEVGLGGGHGAPGEDRRDDEGRGGCGGRHVWQSEVARLLWRLVLLVGREDSACERL